MKVLDEHGNYGAVVRFTGSEWDSLQDLIDGLADGVEDGETDA